MIQLFSNGQLHHLFCKIILCSFLSSICPLCVSNNIKPEFRQWLCLKPTTLVPSSIFPFLSPLTSYPSSPIGYISELKLYLSIVFCHPISTFLPGLSIIHSPHSSESRFLTVNHIEPLSYLEVLTDFLESNASSLSWPASPSISWLLLPSLISSPVMSLSSHIPRSFPPYSLGFCCFFICRETPSWPHGSSFLIPQV